MKTKQFVLIPDLVSLQTNTISVKGFFQPFVTIALANALEGRSNCKEPRTLVQGGVAFADNWKPLFEVVIEKERGLEVPSDLDVSYDFRDGYYYFRKGTWYYRKKIATGADLLFTYQAIGNRLLFKFNQLYSWIPAEIGRIFPVGRIIRDVLFYHLFLKGFVLFTGSAVARGNKCFAYVAPSYNGKSTLVHSKITNGFKYVAEDHLLLDKNLEYVYPVLSAIQGSERGVSRLLSEALSDEKLWVKNKVPLEELHFYANSTQGVVGLDASLKAYAFLLTNSLHFLRDRFVRAIILKDNRGNLVREQIEHLAKALEASGKVRFRVVHNWENL